MERSQFDRRWSKESYYIDLVLTAGLEQKFRKFFRPVITGTAVVNLASVGPHPQE